MTSNWFSQILPNQKTIPRSWLLYSPTDKAAFCFCCVLFQKDGQQHGSFGSSDSFRVWKKLNPRLFEHERTLRHREAFIAWKEMEQHVSQAEIFVKVLEHVVNFTSCSRERQIIVVMDNHNSHLALANILYAKEHGINLVTLPPHAINKTQPLDLSIYGPHKAFFSAAVNSWMLANPGKTVTVHSMAKLMGEAWVKAATPSNIMSGFRMSEIWPCDRHIFSADQFLPLSVSD